MGDDSNKHELIDELADEFVSRKQAGESTTVTEYCQKYPQLSVQIRELFPTLEMLEDVKVGLDIKAGDAPLPEKVGPYRIIGEIGQGGMGVVYEAEHETLGRRVALKALAHQLATDSRARARFEREARAIAKLHHTNIVPLFDVGEDKGQVFLAMQLISGKSFDRVIADAQSPTGKSAFPYSPGESQGVAQARTLDQTAPSESGQQNPYRWIARIGFQAASALAYAHDRGIIHRDVKPSNLLLDDSGVAWLTDFGLAKTDDENLTQTGDFLGTLRYMAPERFKGQCDVRADIYALGLTLYEILAARPAFQSSDRLELIDSICRSEPTPLRSVDAQVPRDLDTVIHKACAKEPAKRYASALELADDLHRFLHDEPILARRVSIPEQVLRWSRRNRGLAAAVFAIGMLTLILGIGSTIAAIAFQRQAGVQSELAEKATVAEKRVRASLKLAQDRGDALLQSLYVAQMNRAAQVSRRPGGVSRVSAFTDAWLPARAGIDLRGWEWYAMRSLCNQEKLVLSGHGERAWSVTWHPSGNQLATSGSQGVFVWHATDGKLIHAVSDGRFVGAVDWSPNGRQLALAIPSLQAVHVLDASNWNIIARLSCQGESPERLCWSTDSKRVLAGCQSGNLFLFQVDEQATVRAFRSEEESEISSIDWHPDGQHFIATTRAGTIQVWEQNSSEAISTIEAHTGAVYEGRFNPAGDMLVSTGDDSVTRLWNWPSRELIGEIQGHGLAFTVQWSPDGTELALGGARQEILLYNVESRTKTRSLLGHQSVVWKLRWGPSGQHIASVDSGVGKVRVWSLQENPATLSFQTQDSATSVAWDTNGGRLAVGCLDGQLYVLDVATREKPLTSQVHSRKIEKICWRQDGQQLATWGFDGTIKTWDLATAGEVQTFDVPDPFGALAWDNKTELLAVFAKKRKVHVANLNHPNESFDLAGEFDRLLSAAFQPGKALATASADNSICFWDPSSRLLLNQIDMGEEQPLKATSLEWNPRATRLACYSRSTLFVWNAINGRRELLMDGHSAKIRSISWSPDGDRIATASRDHTVRIWNAHTGRQLLSLGAEGGVESVRWSNDGMKLAAACDDESGGGRVMIWDASRAYAAEKH